MKLENLSIKQLFFLEPLNGDNSLEFQTHYPKLNGFVEKAVGAIKMLLQKSFDSEEDFYFALLEDRNTLLVNTKSSFRTVS